MSRHYLHLGLLNSLSFSQAFLFQLLRRLHIILFKHVERYDWWHLVLAWSESLAPIRQATPWNCFSYWVVWSVQTWVTLDQILFTWLSLLRFLWLRVLGNIGCHQQNVNVTDILLWARCPFPFFRLSLICNVFLSLEIGIFSRFVLHGFVSKSFNRVITHGNDFWLILCQRILHPQSRNMPFLRLLIHVMRAINVLSWRWLRVTWLMQQVYSPTLRWGWCLIISGPVANLRANRVHNVCPLILHHSRFIFLSGRSSLLVLRRKVFYCWASWLWEILTYICRGTTCYLILIILN